jgi:hypothetical protein
MRRRPHRRGAIERAAAAAVLATALQTTAVAAQSSSGAEGPSAAERYEALSAADDHAGLVALWSELPESAVPVIDRDLEGSLALWEEAGEARQDEIDAMLDRALRGASAATEATGRRRILDYVTSFAGWDDDEKRAFRAGQQACREGRQALGDGDAETALTHGTRCRELAEPLGDWWGTAMGLALEGRAHAARDEDRAAATALARGRLLYRELGLTGSSLGLEADLVPILLRLGHRPRAEALVRDGLATAERLGGEEMIERFRALAADLEGRPGA